MKARIKHAIAIGAASRWCHWPKRSLESMSKPAIGSWISPATSTPFMSNASCDHGDNTAVTGGLACTGDNATSVRNGLLPAAFVFTASTRQDNLDISATIGLYPGINSSAAAGVNGAGLPAASANSRHRCPSGIPDVRRCELGYGEDGTRHRHLRQGRHSRRHDPARRRHGGGQSSRPATPAWAASASATSTPTGFRRSPTPRRTSWDSPASVGAFTPLDDGNYTSHNSPQWQAASPTCWAIRRAISALPARCGSTASLSRRRPRPTAAAVCPAYFLRRRKQRTRAFRTTLHGTAVDGGVKARLWRVSRASCTAITARASAPRACTSSRPPRRARARIQRRLCSTDLQDRSPEDRRELRYLASSSSRATSKPTASSRSRARRPACLASDLVHQATSPACFGLYYSLTKSLTLVGEYIDTRVEGLERERCAREGRRSSAAFCSSEYSIESAARRRPPCDWSRRAA